MSRFFIHCVLALLLIPAQLVAAQTATGKVAVDKHGLLDLSGWDQQSQADITLSGQWKFFPNQLLAPRQLAAAQDQAIPLTVPGNWSAALEKQGWLSKSHGVGTYWLSISGAAANSIANLKLNHVCSNARIFFFPAGNPATQPLQSIGNPSAIPAQSIPSGTSTVLPLQFANAGLHQLLIQVSNFDSPAGGICADVILGSSESIAREIAVSTASVSMIIAMIAMAALYSITIHIKYRQDTASLWLALACFSVASYYFAASGLLEIIFTGEQRWIYEWRYKLCAISSTLAVASILTSYSHSFEGFVPTKLLKLNLQVTGFASLLIILLPAVIVTGLLLALVSYWCLQFSVCLWILFQAVRNHRPYSKAMSLAMLPIIIVTPIDIHNRLTLIDPPDLLIYAMVFFLFVQTQVIGTRFARTYRLAERLSLNLKEEVALQTAELNEQNNKLEYAQKALQSANGALKKLSITDGLTRVHNRMYFEEEFRKEWRRCSRQNFPVSILMIDADHFKQINDSAGHMAGDQCLQAISRKLQQHFKRAGDLVARYGGEEFVAMLPNTDQRKALAVAEGLRSAIERMDFEFKGTMHKVTISIGISTTIPSSTASPDNLLEAADAALYEAKGQGRNRVAIIPMLPIKNPQRNSS